MATKRITVKTLAADVAELRLRFAAHGEQLKTLEAHGPQLAAHGEQLRILGVEFGEMRRTQNQLVDAISRVLDRQTHDSLHLEHLVTGQKKTAKQLATLANRIASLMKVRRG